MYRIVDLQWLNQQARIQLAESNQKLEHEQVLAKKLADSILEMGDLDTADVDYWLCPASIFSGDLIAVQHADDGKLYVILADSSGHGLASSLPTLTTAKVFHSMLERGFTLQKTLSEMNAEVNRFLPIDRFMAAAVFAIDYQHQLIECWNGGLPPVLLVNQQGDVVHQFKSEHLAMSILNKKEFDAATEIYKWQEPLELFAYSDGLIEATDSNNIAFGEQALFKLLKNAPVDGRVEYIKDNVLDYIQTSYAKDDISLLSVNCPITNE
jgi:serine phosphatase RsbU (regulator of sigma subunit)